MKNSFHLTLHQWLPNWLLEALSPPYLIAWYFQFSLDAVIKSCQHIWYKIGLILNFIKIWERYLVLFPEETHHQGKIEKHKSRTRVCAHFQSEYFPLLSSIRASFHNLKHDNISSRMNEADLKSGGGTSLCCQGKSFSIIQAYFHNFWKTGFQVVSATAIP